MHPRSPELARRWVAALMLVPARDREAVVEAVEAEIAATYADDHEPETHHR